MIYILIIFIALYIISKIRCRRRETRFHRRYLRRKRKGVGRARRFRFF